MRLPHYLPGKQVKKENVNIKKQTCVDQTFRDGGNKRTLLNESYIQLLTFHTTVN